MVRLTYVVTVGGSWRPNVGENVVAAEGTVPTFRRIRRTGEDLCISEI